EGAAGTWCVSCPNQEGGGVARLDHRRVATAWSSRTQRRARVAAEQEAKQGERPRRQETETACRHRYPNQGRDRCHARPCPRAMAACPPGCCVHWSPCR